MTATFYLELQNGEKFTWVNHTITKPEEIDWLLKEVDKKLREALANRDYKDLKAFNDMKKGEDFVKEDIIKQRRF